MISKKKQYCYYIGFISEGGSRFNKLISLSEKKSKEEIEGIIFGKFKNIKEVISIEEVTEAIFMETK